MGHYSKKDIVSFFFKLCPDPYWEGPEALKFDNDMQDYLSTYIRKHGSPYYPLGYMKWFFYGGFRPHTWRICPDYKRSPGIGVNLFFDSLGVLYLNHTSEEMRTMRKVVWSRREHKRAIRK